MAALEDLRIYVFLNLRTNSNFRPFHYDFELFAPTAPELHDQRDSEG